MHSCYGIIYHVVKWCNKSAATFTVLFCKLSERIGCNLSTAVYRTAQIFLPFPQKLTVFQNNHGKFCTPSLNHLLRNISLSWGCMFYCCSQPVCVCVCVCVCSVMQSISSSSSMCLVSTTHTQHSSPAAGVRSECVYVQSTVQRLVPRGRRGRCRRV